MTLNDTDPNSKEYWLNALLTHPTDEILHWLVFELLEQLSPIQIALELYLDDFDYENNKDLVNPIPMRVRRIWTLIETFTEYYTIQRNKAKQSVEIRAQRDSISVGPSAIPFTKDFYLAGLQRFPIDSVFPQIAFDIRNRLTAISASGELLGDGDEDLKQVEIRVLLETIQGSVHDLLNIASAIDAYDSVQRKEC